jgi:hypothetical protein
MSVRCLVTPEVCSDQVVPPSVVAVIPPASPTAQHAVALVQATPLSFLTAFDVCCDQVAPPSVVLSAIAYVDGTSPTA